MNVAIFTDNDFDKINGVTTTFRAALQSAPAGIHLRVFTAAQFPVETDAYLALRSIGIPIPFYSEMKMYVPRFWEFLRRARADHIDLVHLTTPGPIGLAALFVASRLRLPLVGSFHTDLAAYATLLSGSRRLGTVMREYMRWPYGKCARVLVPSEHTRQLLISAKADPDRIDVWPRGVDTVAVLSIEAIGRPARELARLGSSAGAPVCRARLSREGADASSCHLGSAPHTVASNTGASSLAMVRCYRCCGSRFPMPSSPVRWPGKRSPRHLPRLIALCFQARTDTAGNVVLEAQASGLPVVVSGSGGPRENMVAGSTGTVCHRDEPGEWAEAIAAALARPTRTRLSQSARQYALSRTWERAMQPLYSAYHDVHDGAATAASADAVAAAAHRA